MEQGLLIGVIMVRAFPEKDTLEGLQTHIQNGTIFDVTLESADFKLQTGKVQLLFAEEKKVKGIERTYKNFCWHHKQKEQEELTTYLFFIQNRKNKNSISRRLLRMCKDGCKQYCASLNEQFYVEVTVIGNDRN